MESIISRSSADATSADLSRRQTWESSIMSTSSGGDSLTSVDSMCLERDISRINIQMDELSFVSNRSSRYTQLIDDLAIIDEIYQSFDSDGENDPYERQVADAARNVAQKKLSADELFQSEERFVNDLSVFKNVYLIPMAHWLKESEKEEFFERYKGLGPKGVLHTIFRQIDATTDAHQRFLREFKERLLIWGPTQFISDIFATFSIQKNMKDPNAQDLIYYLKAPLARISIYSHLLSQMTLATEPAHPDYRSLARISDKFVLREKQWKTIIKDRLSHLNVLEASRVIQGNPAIVTSSRRLYISSTLTRIEATDPHSSSDVRTYLLYNDMFMYTQKLKPGKNSPQQKLQYKGMISLKHSEIVPLSPQIIAKYQEGPKTSKLSFMRKSESQNSDAYTNIYGFEIRVNETATSESISMGSDTYTVPGHSSGNGSKRQIVFRTETETEQNKWIGLLRIVSKQATRKR
ncbi:hypothetical protein K501DRAFT_241267 [Backusella circina FSU 941]|nr:hypothetical protein K501DRAFT_241267 [Backusella circina FSU 941]